MHVLILGARAPACLEWARIFAAANWEVSAADSLKWPISRYSKAVRRYLRLPEPRSDPKAWVAAIHAIIGDLDINLILPTCEEVFYLSHGLPQLPGRVFTADLALLQQLHHKYRFACMVQDWPCAAPESNLISSTAALEQYCGDSHTWVFKPAYSRFANRTLIKPKPAALTKIQPSSSYPWVAQRYAPGKEYCSFSLLVAGQLRAHACYHPRYRVGQSSGIYFEPADIAAIEAFVVQFGEATGYSGQVAFDFIETTNGKFVVLECNPRATSGIHLFGNQPDELISALLAEQAQQVVKPQSKPCMVALAMLALAMPRQLLNVTFWREFQNGKDVIFKRQDQKPVFAQTLALLEIAGRAIRKKSGLLAAATADIEWDGQPLPKIQ